MRSFVASLIASCGLVFAAPAHAAEADAVEAPVPAARAVQIHLDGGPGASTLGLNVGAMATLHLGAFEAGPTVAWSGLLSSKAGGGFAVGAGMHSEHRFAFDALAEGGWNVHHATGSLLSDDPGATGTIPYAGARAGVRWYVGSPKNRTRLTLGIWIYGRRDLESRTVVVRYAETGWLSGTTHAAGATHRLGGDDELGLRLAAGFDLTP